MTQDEWMHPATPVEIGMRPQTSHDQLGYRARESSRVQEPVTAYRTYRLAVAADPDARLAAFTAFVRRALDHARTSRGWEVEDVAREAGVGVNTLYLWRRGNEWRTFPQGRSVEAFCDALGIDPAAAFAILWPGKSTRPVEPEPLGPDEDLITLARRLSDPNVPAAEKFHIRETIRGLASRPARPVDAPRRKDVG